MKKRFSAAIAALVLLPIGFAASAQANPQVNPQINPLWNESTDGDLSNQGASPTQLGDLLSGRNRVRATFNAGATSPSPDYFTITVPEGLSVKGIELREWKALPTFEDVAFFAVQSGPVFDFVIPEDRSSANGLLGWTHLRSTQVGSKKVLTELARSDKSPAASGVDAFYNAEAETYPANLLAIDPELPNRLRGLSEQWVPGATGFDGFLGAGQYSFWLRQGSDTNITAELDFITAEIDAAAATPEPFSLLALGLVSGAGMLLKRRQA